MVIHFGVNVRNKDTGLRLTKENYIRVTEKSLGLKEFDSSITTFEQYCSEAKLSLEKRIAKANKNFDLNMAYFNTLSKDEFDKSLSDLLDTLNFTKVDDLNTLGKSTGYYLMVLDEYKQVYLGVSWSKNKGIRQRIMAHWSREMLLDESIFPESETEIFHIDNFRALDTTRIYVEINDDTFFEYHKIAEIPIQYCLNKAYMSYFGLTIPATRYLELIKERHRVRDLTVFDK